VDDSMDKYQQLFNNSFLVCSQFADTTEGLQFDEEKQAIELFSILSVKMCSQHSKSIAVLLENKLYSDCYIIGRNIIEILFNLRWIKQPKEKSEKLDRVYQLEANPLRMFDSEIKAMEQDLRSSTPSLDPAFVKKHRVEIEKQKKLFPFLLVNSNDHNSNFKSVSKNFLQRVGDMRLRYYHLYRFASMFIHPNPKLKEIFLSRVAKADNELEEFLEPLRIYLAYILLFIELTIGYGIELLIDFNPEHHKIREDLYSQMVKIVNSGNNDYFSIPPNR